MIKKITKKIHPVPAASTGGPRRTVIAVCRQNGNCVDPEQSRLIWFCIVCPDDQFENLRSLR